MKKINELTKGKAKSMFTTDNDDQLIMHFSVMILQLLMEKRRKLY